ncbi:MAG: zinc ribbon domain-containing protein [Desulfovibrio sp.]|nr:zinc ribbon domain-containing protein [Desulfovibrio sp.]
MPIYEYVCEKCKREFEEIVFDKGNPSCPDCSSGKTRRLISLPARYSGGSGDDDYAQSTSSGGCAGCSGGNCANCGH